MIESSFIFYFFCLIVTLQSAVGVGILVLGTPFLLILNYSIVNILFILLPISIFTSFFNLLIMKYYNKISETSTFSELKKFFIICVPSIIIGLIILKFFQNYINFKLFVSIIILLSVCIISLKDKIKFKINFFRKSILSIVGVIHGLTNSGGTLMSLAFSSYNNKNYARFNITFFYFILALSQYLITIIIFYDNFIFPKNINLIFSCFLGIWIGNILINYIDKKKYLIAVNVLAIITSLILMLSN